METKCTAADGKTKVYSPSDFKECESAPLMVSAEEFNELYSENKRLRNASTHAYCVLSKISGEDAEIAALTLRDSLTPISNPYAENFRPAIFDPEHYPEDRSAGMAQPGCGRDA